MKKYFKRFTWKKALSVVMALVSVAGAVFGIVKLSETLKDDTKEINPKFEVGGLITETGLYDPDEKAAIYTKDAFSAKGLEVKLDFDATVKYQVFFYDKLDNFISATEVFTRSEDIAVPIGAYARFEVTPVWGEDAPLEKEVKWYEVNGYANQLDIRVDKDQRLLESDFTKYSITGNSFIKHDNKDISTGALESSENYDVYEFSLTGESGYVLDNDALSYFDFEYTGIHGEDLDIILFVVSPNGQVSRTIWSGISSGSSFENPLSWDEGSHIYLRTTKGFFNSYDVDMFLYFCELV